MFDAPQEPRGAPKRSVVQADCAASVTWWPRRSGLKRWILRYGRASIYTTGSGRRVIAQGRVRAEIRLQILWIFCAFDIALEGGTHRNAEGGMGNLALYHGRGV